MSLRVQVLTTRLFTQPASGGEACTARLLAALVAQGCRVEVAGRGEGAPLRAFDGMADETAAETTHHGGGSLRWRSLGPLSDADQPFASWPRWRRAAHVAAALVTGRSSTMLRLHGAGRGQAPAALTGAVPADVLVVDHLQAWPWAQALDASAAPILVMHNLESDGYAEQAAADAHPLRRAFLAREARLLASLERAALSRAAVVACLSEADAEVMRTRMADATAPVEVLPGYPTAGPPIRTRSPDGHELRRIGLLGTWSWGPNRRALEWLLSDVVPRLPGTCEVQVAGSGAEPALATVRRGAAPVRWLGRIPDIADFYAGIDVVAVPALGGSGVQEKAIEAIATGLPVVATRHALRGLGPGLPDHVHCADSGADFAALCATVKAPEPAAAAAQLASWSAGRQRAYRVALERCVDAARAAASPGVGRP